MDSLRTLLLVHREGGVHTTYKHTKKSENELAVWARRAYLLGIHEHAQLIVLPGGIRGQLRDNEMLRYSFHKGKFIMCTQGANTSIVGQHVQLVVGEH